MGKVKLFKPFVCSLQTGQSRSRETESFQNREENYNLNSFKLVSEISILKLYFFRIVIWDNMKRIIFITFLILITQHFTAARVISFNKDSLLIEGNGFYDDIKDSLFIKNDGSEVLIIDSIYTAQYYGYRVTLTSADTVYLFYFAFDNIPDTIRIQPQDSILLEFYSPDLCPICADIVLTTFNDTIYFRNNSINNTLAFIRASGEGFSDVELGKSAMNETYFLKQNYPNPFNLTTTIEFYIPYSSNLKLNVYNSPGQQITTLIDEELSAGNHKVIFDGSGYPGGVYFYEMTSGNYRSTKKFIYLK